MEAWLKESRKSKEERRKAGWKGERETGHQKNWGSKAGGKGRGDREPEAQGTLHAPPLLSAAPARLFPAFSQ